jgi:AraC-like DNA-binding protein
MRYIETPPSGDPSDIVQNFQKIQLDIHCCRYWWLKHWKHQRLLFPFWRLYWNLNEGATVFYDRQIVLNPDRIILIPPNTPFSTDIKGDRFGKSINNIMEGGWIDSSDLELNSIQNGYILHFFIHFNLGYPFDNITPGVYSTEIQKEQKNIIQRVIDTLKCGATDFDFYSSIDIYTLILSSVASLDPYLWHQQSIDPKILEIMSYINRNFRKNLPNEKLAETMNMSTNSFARLFKQQTGHSPQKYLAKIRIENACNLLHHSILSINEIAEHCGFSDRYYFTKVFTSLIFMPPAQYRKQVLLKRD